MTSSIVELFFVRLVAFGNFHTIALLLSATKGLKCLSMIEVAYCNYNNLNIFGGCSQFQTTVAVSSKNFSQAAFHGKSKTLSFFLGRPPALEQFSITVLMRGVLRKHKPCNRVKVGKLNYEKILICSIT